MRLDRIFSDMKVKLADLSDVLDKVMECLNGKNRQNREDIEKREVAKPSKLLFGKIPSVPSTHQ